MDKDSVDNIFRDFHQHWEPDVPTDAWEKIEAQLDKPGRKRRWILFLWLGLFIGTSILGSMYAFLHAPSEKEGVAMTKANREEGTGKKGLSSAQEVEESALTSPIPSYAKVEKSQAIQDQPKGELEEGLLTYSKSRIRTGNDSLVNGILLLEKLRLREIENIKNDLTSSNRLLALMSGNIELVVNIQEEGKFSLSDSNVKQLVDPFPSKKLPPMKRESKVKIYGGMMPTWNFQHINPNQADGILISDVKRRSPLDFARIVLHGSVGLEIAINERWNYYAGISSVMGTVPIVYDFESISQYKTVPGSNMEEGLLLTPTFQLSEEVEIAHNLSQVGIQLGFSRRLFQSKWPQYVSVGTQLWAALPQQDLSLANGRIRVKPQNRWVPTVDIAYYWEIPIFQRSAIRVGPNLNHALVPWQYEGAPFDVIPYQLGLRLLLLQK